ncbi:DUF3846 domain-containing protein [Rhodococcus sp. NPDC003318]|uniref:DUF3846 domain-containing protein n=1 Tax=Rhodococcus sp. NPDC003318 TaxID=3364503 RepID=UPI0036AFEDD5
MTTNTSTSGAVVETVTAVRIDADGTAEVIELARSGSGEGVGVALREAIGCRWFDVVALGPGLDMWVDDEGLVVNEPVVNVVATLIARSYGFRWQPYAGTVVFTSSDDEGDAVSLSRNQVAALVATADVGGLVIVDATEREDVGTATSAAGAGA